MSKSIVQEKSFAFAVRIVRFCRHLRNEGREFTLSSQVLRSGTSIGANIEEALGGQSRRDFLAKMSIAAKEARETLYWLRLLDESGGFAVSQIDEMLKDCHEILTVLNSIILTTRKKLASDTKSSSLSVSNSALRTQHLELRRRLP